MASAQVVETLVANNSPSQDSNHPDDLFQSRPRKIIEEINGTFKITKIPTGEHAKG